MSSIHATLIALGTSKDWLIAANFILSVLLGLWMLRYRTLYIQSRVSQANYHDLIDNLSEGVYRSTLDGQQLSANKALVRLNGYASEAEMLACVSDIGREWYVEPGRRDEFRRILQRDGHVEDFVSEIYRHKTRERIWISESARLVRDKRSGKPLYCEGSVREVTETLKRLNLEAQFRKLTSELPGALFQFVTRDGRRHPTSSMPAPGSERITGIRRRTSSRGRRCSATSCTRPTSTHSVNRCGPRLRPAAPGTPNSASATATAARSGCGSRQRRRSAARPSPGTAT